jgi:hypothetical protein
MEMQPNAISWLPEFEYRSVVFVVVGPGEYQFRRIFPRGESIHFPVAPDSEASLADGQYAYELRFAPVIDADVRELLRAARETGDSSVPKRLKQQGKLPDHELVQSGCFRIHDGALVVPADTEPSTGSQPEGLTKTEDEPYRIRRPFSQGVRATISDLINDDLYVIGSACIGGSCVNGEALGYNTLLLKADNIRIRAEDTSAVGPFPRNDWQITFNETTFEGADKFSIEDITHTTTPLTIEPAAPDHSLYVADNGYLGLGTSTPAHEIDVVDGDTPTLRLNQDHSASWDPQIWDIAGNEVNFFIRDTTHGSRLVFRVFRIPQQTVFSSNPTALKSRLPTSWSRPTTLTSRPTNSRSFRTHSWSRRRASSRSTPASSK